jgi:hypothetical protein
MAAMARQRIEVVRTGTQALLAVMMTGDSFGPAAASA